VPSYSDLEPCDYLGRWGGVLLAVGWLGAEQPYSKGEVAPAFFKALFELGRDPWQPALALGRHRCPWCRFTGAPAHIHFEGTTMPIGTSNIFVPGETKIFVAPSLVAHYIDAHEYSPPTEFQDAVLRCPPMKSFAYMKELKAKGLNPAAVGPAEGK
jgi:hypothetical protein